MTIYDFGLLPAGEAVKKGSPVSQETALLIAQKARAAIEYARQKKYSNIWQAVASALREYFPTENYALIAVWQSGESSEPYGEVLIGHDKHVDVDTMTRAHQWIRVRSYRRNQKNLFFILNLKQ